MRTRPAVVRALAAAAFWVVPANAQVYPSRPITMVVPFPAGGPSDGVARILAAHMRQSLARTLTIKNVSGAGGTIGVGQVARATPDGYTLVAAIAGTHVVNGAIYTLPYDVVKDFEPIALTARESLIITAKKAMPAKDLNELIAWLKANPNKATQANGGNGTPSHIAGVFFQSTTGTQ